MSNNNDNQKTAKPQPQKLSVQVHRTVSTGYEQKALNLEPQSSGPTDKSETPKLSVGAKSFIPKSKRNESDRSGSTTSINKQNTTSNPTTAKEMPMQQNLSYGAQMPYLPQSSMVNYTYMNYSPNTGGPGFFTGYPQPYYGGQMAPQYMPQPRPSQNMASSSSQAPTKGSSTSVSLDSTKKSNFNKDAPPFVPKTLKTSQITLVDQKVEKTVALKTDENKPVLKKEEKVEENQAEVNEKTIQKEAANVAPTTTKTSEKKSKLNSLFNNPDKEEPPKKEQAETNRTPIVMSQPKNKQKDIHKEFAEKSKKFKEFQKEEEKKKLQQQNQKKEIRENKVEPRVKPKVEADYESESEPSSDESELLRVVENNYFRVDPAKPQEKKRPNNIFSLDYMLSFSSWKISQEDKLLDSMLKDHIHSMKTTYKDERDRRKGPPKPVVSSSEPFVFRRSEMKPQGTELIKKGESTKATDKDLGKWGRKDLRAQEAEAKEFLEKLNEERKKDPTKKELTTLLNQLTLDNYPTIKKELFQKIHDDVHHQRDFLHVLFKKAVSEKAYVTLYSKLCTELDKELPQKSERTTTDRSGKHVAKSEMRSMLLEKCKEIFKAEDNTKIDEYINLSDPQEREFKLKRFLLGNVNFIGELINTRLLSKRIVFQCLNNLFTRIEKTDVGNLQIRHINIEGIVILVDKFGTMLKKQFSKMKEEDYIEFTKKIDEYLAKLEQIQENDKTIPGHIKYKIINLLDKRKRGWEETILDKTTSAMSKDQVMQNIESEMSGQKEGDKLEIEEVISRIKTDLVDWKDIRKKGYHENDYNWYITEDLIFKHGNSLADILTAFGENCIDVVQKQEDIGYAYEYIREIIRYYENHLDKKAKFDVVEVVINFLENFNDFCLDNNLMFDVWGAVIYLLEFYKIFTLNQLDRLTNLQEEQTKTVFEIINIMLNYDAEKKKDKIKELLTVNLVKSNKNMFDRAIAEN